MIEPEMETEAEQAERLSGQFHQILGECIAEWAIIEEQLFRICWAVLRCPAEQAAIVYYRTPSLDARFKLTDELLRLVLPKPERKSGGHSDKAFGPWSDILNDYEKLRPTRNRMAHHPVRAEGNLELVELEDGTLKHRGSVSWYELYVSEAERLRGKDDETPVLKIQDLMVHRIFTASLWFQLKEFFDKTLRPHVEGLPPPSSPYRSD